MPTQLEQLLDAIQPSKTIDPVEKSINKALAGFYQEKNVVSSWEEYQHVLAEFVRQARNVAVNAPLNAGQSVDINFGEALRYLKNDYPGDTLQIVYDIVRTGAEGGLYQIFRTLARRMAEDISQNVITAKVVKYWDNLSTDEKLSVPYEYIEKYKDILPREIVEGDNVRFRGYFWKVLQQHPGMLKTTQELGRPYNYNL